MHNQLEQEQLVLLLSQIPIGMTWLQDPINSLDKLSADLSGPMSQKIT